MILTKTCSINVAVRLLTSIVDTAAEAADTTIETTAEMIAEMITETTTKKTAEKAAEKGAEKTTERTTEKTTRSMMMLKIESKLMILKTKMIDVDEIDIIEKVKTTSLDCFNLEKSSDQSYTVRQVRIKKNFQISPRIERAMMDFRFIFSS